jgi:hypothetical protein
MLVLIDVTGLPWARDYYRMFPFEPSRKAEDDMLLGQASTEYIEHPTLVTVMQAMIKAAEKGEKEVLIVAHGNEKGLVMKISGAIPVSAGVSVVKWLPVAADAFELIDSSGSLPKNRAYLSAWARIAAEFEAQADESQVDGIATRIANEELSDAGNDVMKACSHLETEVTRLILRDPKGLVHMLRTTEQGLREVATLTRQVRDAEFSRIELRSCNIGSGPGIEALRSFFACTRLMAPVVHTFYVPVNAPDNNSKQLEQSARRAGPRWRKFYADDTQVPLDKSHLAPFARPFIDPPQAILPGGINFMLNVTRVETPHYHSEARRLNGAAVSTWVTRFIHRSATYSGRGTLWVGGLDGPTPAGAPYTLPQDSNYRSMIAVATAAGVDR